jgi:hypothetical protein
MQLDRLTIALRPRPARQALDLGFALLHARAGTVYKAWLALWLPLVAITAVLTVALPGYAVGWLLLPWWLKPLLERAPLDVLSWWRPIMAGRGLYQPIWQLEQARGAAASRRRALIAGNGTGRAAYLFGIACAHFEAILQFGLLAFAGMFTSEDQFQIFSYLSGEGGLVKQLLPLFCYAIGGAILGPVYTACCFTLYLNRRATLEAWDIELVLRQIRAPGERQTQAGGINALMLALALTGALLLAPPDTAAAAPSAAPSAVLSAAPAAPPSAPPPVSPPAPPAAASCASMPALFPSEHLAAHDAQQRALRQEVDEIYAGDDLRGYDCQLSWRLRKGEKKPQPKNDLKMPDLGWLAGLIKLALIAAAIGGVAWLLYRYGNRLRLLLPAARAPLPATEIAGLDIRAESLPPDVTAQVRQLWLQGERRGALALLYRATLSRLVERHGVHLAQGATEGDCLRVAAQALQRRQLDDAGHAVMASVTTLWLQGAYANRWPDAIDAACNAWDARWRTPAQAGGAA